MNFITIEDLSYKVYTTIINKLRHYGINKSYSLKPYIMDNFFDKDLLSTTYERFLKGPQEKTYLITLINHVHTTHSYFGINIDYFGMINIIAKEKISLDSLSRDIRELNERMIASNKNLQDKIDTLTQEVKDLRTAKDKEEQDKEERELEEANLEPSSSSSTELFF